MVGVFMRPSWGLTVCDAGLLLDAGSGDCWGA